MRFEVISCQEDKSGVPKRQRPPGTARLLRVTPARRKRSKEVGSSLDCGNLIQEYRNAVQRQTDGLGHLDRTCSTESTWTKNAHLVELESVTTLSRCGKCPLAPNPFRRSEEN